MPQSTSNSSISYPSIHQPSHPCYEPDCSSVPSQIAQTNCMAIALRARLGLRSLARSIRSHQVQRSLIGLLAIGEMLSIGACATAKPQTKAAIEPISEAELAAKKLQQPLEQHLCSASVYPKSSPDWKIKRVVSLQGRGENFHAALEALCREADGQKFPAVVDIYYERALTAWSQHHAIRGTAVRYIDGFAPPTAPELSTIKPPETPKLTDEEPAPFGEGAQSKQ